MKFRYLTKEWVIALLLGAVVLAASHTAFMARTDGWLYTFGQHLVRTADQPLAQLAVVGIDKVDLEKAGGKAGERLVLAEVLEKLRHADPAAIGILMPLSGSGRTPALNALDTLDAAIPTLSLSKQKAAKLTAMIHHQQRLLDTDNRIARAMAKSGPTVLPLYEESDAGKATDMPLTHAIMLRLQHWFDPFRESHAVSLQDLGRPQARFADSAKGIGWLSILGDSDGDTRSFELAHAANAGHPIAGMPLLLAAASQRTTPAIMPGKVQLADYALATDANWRGFIRLYYHDDTLILPQHYALHSFLDPAFNPSTLKGKIVLIADDAMLRPAIPADDGEMLSITDLTAIATANILNHDLFAHSNTMLWSELLLFVLALLLLALVIPRMRFGFGIALVIAAVLLLIGATQYLLLTKQLWLQTALPVSLLLAGMVLIGLRRLYAAQALQHQNEVAHTQRQLGLAYQEQGKLELAFESFQKLPPNRSALELLYNLALDFERRRRYERAVAAYQHILQHDTTFKDAIARKLNAEKMERSLTMSSGQFTASILLMPDENGQKPSLGRYEVEKELGRGAMGAVYLGRDPKIDRTVAIKTLALSQEFDADELQEVENRFFHEAAAAGRLNHPNIVTIYDAGEEHDLAYIAMEYIDGRPLNEFIQEKRLLPVATVLNIVAQVASGLDYASKQGVVHRDIKPGNIMYNDKSGVVKIADFGIARITSSSRTKTGAILGTPAYMSPEQISCQKVDGRSDIFSLGATLFAMLTGKKPFNADSVAALTYQITSEKHPDPTKLRQDLPPCIKSIIDKALQKEPDNRYQDGTAMRRAIMRCLKNINDAANN